MIYDTLLVEPRDGVDIVTLNKPERLNTLDLDMVEDLTAYFAALQQRLDARVVILKSTGKAFSAGADLNAASFVPPGPGRAQKQIAMQRLHSNITRLMRNCPQPIICVIQGAACGGSFSLVLAADVRLATPEAKMNAAYMRIGLGGGDMGSSYLLPRLVGASAAAEIILTGRFIGAERAKAIGLVSDVLPNADAAFEAAWAMAQDMLKAAPLGLRLTKENLNLAIDAPSLDAALAFEDRQQVLLLETSDFHEAVAAFRDRRPPLYADE